MALPHPDFEHPVHCHTITTTRNDLKKLNQKGIDNKIPLVGGAYLLEVSPYRSPTFYTDITDCHLNNKLK